jgi:hypothetical protein
MKTKLSSVFTKITGIAFIAISPIFGDNLCLSVVAYMVTWFILLASWFDGSKYQDII